LTVGLVAVVTACSGSEGTDEACDRDCLMRVTDAYLAAMVARDPGKAPVTPTVRFTENTRPLALGQGAWETITGIRDYKLFVTEVDGFYRLKGTAVVVER
jgi:hypothetical protein